ncbi:hypothetical protein GLE_5547 [Lysobacter enzymogenes]|uniref:Uncharacterized protein n=1 Tax=Lysobacter enzymogenes TaxID=69 RepID=A0A0S2DRS6_LYSEN|nr:hypothetical protein GLE_0010 [Lysobacter enzymogenes]ALN60888.1 hypothetical protein GLE_5547 [Lysobacter enzymogenes]
MIFSPESIDRPFLKLFKIQQRVVRTARSTDQLIQLDLDCLGIAVLRILY